MSVWLQMREGSYFCEFWFTTDFFGRSYVTLTFCGKSVGRWKNRGSTPASCCGVTGSPTEEGGPCLLSPFYYLLHIRSLFSPLRPSIPPSLFSTSFSVSLSVVFSGHIAQRGYDTAACPSRPPGSVAHLTVTAPPYLPGHPPTLTLSSSLTTAVS